jgi:hypothetical protein
LFPGNGCIVAEFFQLVLEVARINKSRNAGGFGRERAKNEGVTDMFILYIYGFQNDEYGTLEPNIPFKLVWIVGRTRLSQFASKILRNTTSGGHLWRVNTKNVI